MLICTVAPDNSRFFIQIVLIFFLFFHENIHCGYSLEAPHRDASNEYPQCMFSWRNKKDIHQIPILSGAMPVLVKYSMFFTWCRLLTLENHVFFFSLLLPI